MLLPERMTVRGAGEAVAGALQIQDGMQGEHQRNYYDTFDGLLHAAGLSLVHEDGMLTLIEREAGHGASVAHDAAAARAAVRRPTWSPARCASYCGS